jgi:hypothetical protein
MCHKPSHKGGAELTIIIGLNNGSCIKEKVTSSKDKKVTEVWSLSQFTVSRTVRKKGGSKESLKNSTQISFG